MILLTARSALRSLPLCKVAADGLRNVDNELSSVLHTTLATLCLLQGIPTAKP